MKLTWYEGTRPPRPDDLEDGRRVPAEGGVIHQGKPRHDHGGRLRREPADHPRETHAGGEAAAEDAAARQTSHELDWVRACKTGMPAGADFAYSGPLTETCLLGNIAKRVDGRIAWDAASLKISNLPEANRYIHSEYRKGWKLG